jgi:acyl-phosphate glycerol 3-phosphate acyltransferase
MTLTLVLLASYVFGAIPFGYLVARARGVDILRQGSGNIGATNVGRVLGHGWGVFVFVLDFAKGAVPVLAADHLAPGPQAAPLPVAAGVAAFLGHLFPVYLRFRGGKGVATAGGVVAVLVPVPFLVAFLTWLTVFVSTRTMSLASLLAAAVLCLTRLAATPDPWAPDERVVTAFCLAAAALVVARHHANIRRLLSGTENRFPESAAMTQLTKILHVLAVGLWFGTVVFFTVAGLVEFQTLEQLTSAPAQERPPWLPVPRGYDKVLPGEGFPHPLAKEQGSRLFGTAVGPLFPWYHGIQTGCTLIALVTALAWVRLAARVHRVRAWVLAVGLASVLLGWWLYFKVEELRVKRNALTDAVIAAPVLLGPQLDQAEESRVAFGRWHGYSLGQNFLTLVLVTVAMILAASLPAPPALAPPAKGGGQTAAAPAEQRYSDQPAGAGGET